MAFDGMLAMPDCPTCKQCEPPCIIVWDTFDGNLSFFVVTGTASVENSELTLTGAGSAVFTNISHPVGEFGSSSVKSIVYLEENQEAAVCIGDDPDNCIGVYLSRIGCATSRLFKIRGGTFEWVSELRALPEEMNGEYHVKLCWQQEIREDEEPEEEPSGEEVLLGTFYPIHAESNDPFWVNLANLEGNPPTAGAEYDFPGATQTGVVAIAGFPDVNFPVGGTLTGIAVGIEANNAGFEEDGDITLTLLKIGAPLADSEDRSANQEIPRAGNVVGSGGPGDLWNTDITGADLETEFVINMAFTATAATHLNLISVSIDVYYIPGSVTPPLVGRLSCNIGHSASEWPHMVYLEAQVTFSGLYAGLICYAGSARFDQFLWTFLPGVDADGKVVPGEYDGCPSCFPICGLFKDDVPEENACDWEVIGGNLILRHTNPESEEGLRVRVVGLPVTPTAGFKVYVDWADIDNHRYVQVISDGTSGRLHIYRVKGGVTALISSSPATILYNGQDYIQVRICWRGDAVLAEAGGGIVQITDTEVVGGTRVGLDGVSTFQQFESDSLGAECDPCTAAGGFCLACIPGTTHHHFLATIENLPENPNLEIQNRFPDLSHSRIVSFGGSSPDPIGCFWSFPAPQNFVITGGLAVFTYGLGVSATKDANGHYWLSVNICLGVPGAEETGGQPCGTFGLATWGIDLGTTLPDCSKLNYENLPLISALFFEDNVDGELVPWYNAAAARVSVRVM